MRPKVAIVVLNWNKPDETIECLRSVGQSDYPNYSVLVVDNGSEDDSVARIRQAFPTVRVLETGSNLGYAEGNNVGIRHALQMGARYVLVLNNDVRVAPTTIRQLVSVAEGAPDAAFLGPTIYHLEEPDHIQSAGTELDYLWRPHQRGLDERDVGQFTVVEEVTSIIGAAILVNAQALQKIGLLDVDYFLYYEDVDWCLRARKLGYRIIYVPEAKAWHRSHHVREADLPQITYYMARNSLVLIQKGQGGLVRLLLATSRHLMTAATWTVRPKWRNKRAERDALLRGIYDFITRKAGPGCV